MNHPKFNRYIIRQGVYWKWAVLEQHTDGHRVFTDGLCLRYSTAIRKCEEVISREEAHWDWMTKMWEETEPPDRFRKN